MLKIRVSNQCADRVRVTVDVDADGNVTVTVESIPD